MIIYISSMNHYYCVTHQSIQLHNNFRGPLKSKMNLGHFSLTYTNTPTLTDIHIVTSLQKKQSYMCTCMYRHMLHISKISYRCFLQIYAALVYILQAHCVTVVSFIHSWIIRGLMGGCGNGRDATTPFICAPVHPHSPFAIRRGRRMSHTPALHVRDTHCLIDTTQWYTPSSGAGIDIWAAETKGNGAHFSASTYSSVVSGQVRKVTFPAVIKGIGLHNNQGGSYKRQQTSSQLSFCCTTGLGCHINIYSNCLLCCSNL